VLDINNTLNLYYDTLKWVENSAVDLKFQVEEVEEKIERASHGSSYQGPVSFRY
jgi:hypothetical protein